MNRRLLLQLIEQLARQWFLLYLPTRFYQPLQVFLRFPTAFLRLLHQYHQQYLQYQELSLYAPEHSHLQVSSDSQLWCSHLS